MTVETFTVRRRLTPAQQERRARVLDAAVALARDGGYEAVMMKDVADRAGVALATVYRYFASKDQMLAEALVGWGGVLDDRLHARPPRGATPADRVLDVLGRALRAVEVEPEFARAVTAALLSPDPAVADSQAGYNAMMRRWIDLALADASVPDRDRIAEVLEHVFFSGMVGLVNGRRSPAQLRAQLERATRLLLDR